MRILFINTPPRNCGVQHYGAATFAVLAQSKRLRVIEAQLDESTSIDDYLRILGEHRPDFAYYNYHPTTMPWLDGHALIRARAEHPEIQHVAIAHDQAPALPHLTATIHLDPSIAETYREFPVGRILPHAVAANPAPANVIGSFGYAGDHKNFPRVVELANAEFDTATVRIHMPSGHYGDSDGAVAARIAAECRACAKPGIRVEVSHDHLTREGVVEWLAGNTVNVFLYDHVPGAGVSSAIDFALAAGRPIAINDSNMFRHLIAACPGAVLGPRRTLRAIVADGFAPLADTAARWSTAGVVRDYERIFTHLADRPRYDLRSNRVLTPADREALRPVVDELHRLEPGITSRKIPEAVFQNAFVYQQAKAIARTGDKILLVGGFEDPIGPALRKLGHDVRITDPAIDHLDGRDVWRESIERTGERYDLVISCSVIEHVYDDTAFIGYLYALAKPGGTVLLTTDYNDEWRPGMHKPDSDVRIYDAARMRLLAAQVPREALLDAPSWGPSEPYFEIVGAHYGFCSLAYYRHHVEGGEDAPHPTLDRFDEETREQGARLRALASMCQCDEVVGKPPYEAAQIGILRVHRLHRELHERLAEEHAHCGRLQAELDRLGTLRNAGPRTVRVLSGLQRAARRVPFVRSLGRAAFGAMRRTKQVVRGAAGR